MESLKTHKLPTLRINKYQHGSKTHSEHSSPGERERERENTPGPSISAKIVVKSSSLTPTLIPSGGVSSRFFNSFASCLITFGGRFSFVACSNKIIIMITGRT